MDEEEYPPEDESLFPIKEDISEWLSIILGCVFSPQSLFEEIQTGSVLCEVAHTLYKHTHVEAPGENTKPLPAPPTYSHKAMPGSFLARDNTANFIAWCRRLGVNEAYMFESEGLVLQRQRRNVLLCLLEVARISSRSKTIPVPHLIQLEKAINLEEASHKQILEEMGSVDNAFSHIPPTLNIKRRKEALQLDNAVHKVIDNPKFKGQVNIERTGEGRYRIFDKVVFIRCYETSMSWSGLEGGGILWNTILTHMKSPEPNRHTSY